MHSTFFKIAITFLPISAIVAMSYVFYSVVILGKQLVYANSTSYVLVIFSYLFPIIVSIAAIIATWRK